MLTSRLARIVDRARALEARREMTQDAEVLKHIDWDLKMIARRARYINGAIALSTTSAFLTTIVVMLLFSGEFVKPRLGGYIAGMFVLSMIGLSIAFLMFLFEVRIATRSLRIGGRVER